MLSSWKSSASYFIEVFKWMKGVYKGDLGNVMYLFLIQVLEVAANVIN